MLNWNQIAVLLIIVIALYFLSSFSSLKEGYYPWWRQRLPWWRRRWGRNYWYEPQPPFYYTRYGYYPYYSYY